MSLSENSHSIFKLENLARFFPCSILKKETAICFDPNTFSDLLVDLTLFVQVIVEDEYGSLSVKSFQAQNIKNKYDFFCISTFLVINIFINSMTFNCK